MTATRDVNLYLDDILVSVQKIQSYTRMMSREELYRDTQVQDAVIRRLEIIGEAVKNIPSEVVEATHENEAKITNTHTATLNTGFNTAEEVNGDTKMTTGEIEFETKVENEKVNTNEAEINSADEDVTVKTSNEQTQSNSVNLAQAKVDNEIIEHDQNELTIENNTATAANTGGNACKEINGGCELETGDIRGKVTTENRGNNNDKEINPSPTPTVAPSPTEKPTPTPRAERPPAPTKAPPAPSPTEAPEGGPGPVEPSPAPTEAEEPEITPTPTEQPEGVADGEEEEPREEKPLQEKVKEAIKKLVPEVQAAETEKEKEEKPQVLGITALPITGIGYNGMGVGVNDIIFGLSLITGGLFIRRGTQKPEGG